MADKVEIAEDILNSALKHWVSWKALSTDWRQAMSPLKNR